jgi:lipopolysaccharide transport system permease protein
MKEPSPLRDATVSFPPASGDPDGAPGEAAVERPVLVLERRRGWLLPDLGELWRSRELLYFLTWRDIKLRYKQTALGAAWAVLQPLAVMAVFSMFLGRMPGVAEELPYAYSLFVFAGLLPWMFFANAVTAAGQSLVGNQQLVTKVYFPRLIIPLGAVAAGLVDFLIAFGMLLGLMLWHRLVGEPVGPGWLLLVPPLVLGLVFAATGMGVLLAALTVRYRDFRFVVPFLVQLWMFATPCIYLPPNLVGAWHWLLPFNPAYGLILNFRQAMLGGPLDAYALFVSGGVSLGLLIGGGLYFRRVERGFADII